MDAVQCWQLWQQASDNNDRREDAQGKDADRNEPRKGSNLRLCFRFPAVALASIRFAQPGHAPVTDLKRTPLHDLCQAANGRMVPFAGWEMAVQFSGLVAEHTAVRQAVGVFDISHMGVLRFSGPNPKMPCRNWCPPICTASARSGLLHGAAQ